MKQMSNRTSFLTPDQPICSPAEGPRGRSRRGAICALATLLLAATGLQAQAVFSTPQPLGTAVSQTVTVTASAAGQVSSVQVLTAGAPNLDFTAGTGAVTTPCAAATLAAAGTCQVSVTFTPIYPGLRQGAVVLLNSSNAVLGTAYVSGIGQGGLDVLSPGNVLTVAGKFRAYANNADGIQATVANFQQPTSVAFDGLGNMYIADSGLTHNRVRMVCAGTATTIAGTSCPGAGIVVAVAGTGTQGYTGDNGPAKDCSFAAPTGVAIDGAGNLYIADFGNHVVRKVSASTGIITTAAGNGSEGNAGDGSLATAAGVELSSPIGVTVDPAGNLYIADFAGQRIRRVDAISGIITTAAGNGHQSGAGDGKGTYSGDNGLATAAGLSQPYNVAFDASGNMYIPDSANNRIRVVKAVGGAITPASTISTIAGNGNGGDATCPTGIATAEALNTPSGVALDAAGNLYIGDSQDSCVRKVNVGDNTITTLAINGAPDLLAGNLLSQAQIFAPTGMAVDGLGNVYEADPYYMLINKIQSNKAVLNFSTTAVLEGEQSSTYQAVTVENDGNLGSNLTAVTTDPNAALDPSTTCTSTLALTQDQDCLLNAYFAPSTTGDPLLGNVFVAGNTVNDNNAAAPLDVVLVGDASQFVITLTANPAPTSAFGASVTFTATVASNKGNPTGTVVFTDSLNGAAATTLKTENLSGGQAVFATTGLAVGVHTITATYGADVTTATVTQTVYEATTTALTASPVSPSTLGTPVVLTANITAPAGGAQTLSGSIAFTDNGATLTTVPVTTNGLTGTATYTANALPQGSNALTAVFTPTNATLVAGSTGTLTQVVQAPATLNFSSSPNPSTYGSAVTFSVSVPTVGTTSATNSVKIAIVPQGQTTPVYNLPTITLSSTGGGTASGSGTISTLPVGTYTATATYTGDNNYSAATATLATPQVVNGVGTGVTATATPNPGIAGKAVTIAATVAPTSGTVAPTGSVTFVDTFNGATTTLGSAVNLTKGAASISPSLAVGSHSILVTYSGDADDASSTFTLPVTVNQATTTTTVTASPDPGIVAGTITFTAVVAGNGGIPQKTVAFSATSGSNTVNLGTGTLDASGKTSVTNATLAAGTYTITATYSGDTNDAPGTPGTLNLTVGAIPTVTNLTTATTSGNNPQTILVATVANNNAAGPAPTGSVAFMNGSTTVGTATLTDGAATLTPNLAAGNYSIVAVYTPDAQHSGSQSAAVSITTLGSSYSIGITPNAVSVSSSQNAIVTVKLSSVSGFTDTIGLGCASLPAGVNCHFSNPSVKLAANGTATAQLTIDTNNPLGGGATAMNQPSSRRTVAMAGILLPFSLLLGWCAFTFRRRNSGLWSVLLVLALSVAAFSATGCTGFTQTSAAPGTYTMQVVGVGVNSNVPAYQTITLTITK